MEKNKKLIVLGVLALMLAISGITYAILTWTSSKINIGLTSNCFTIDYTKGQDITNQSIKLINEKDLISDGKFTIKDGIALTYANTNNEIYKYLIVVYIDNSLVDNDVIGSSFAGNISAEAYQGKLGADYTLQRLNSLNNTIKVDTSKTPDFSTVSGNNGVKKSLDDDSTIASNQGDGTKGIYSTEDDFGTSYYFRGAVENNYVKFANKYWRIIRINGDGSIRMIYAGTSAYANGESETDSLIGTSAYNTNYEDNTYVGYMYGTKGATTYASTHSNTNNSTIKEYIDNWYIDNLKEYSHYLEDTIYCSDRKTANINNVMGMTLTGDGSGTNESGYAGAYRAFISHSPTLKCENKNDRFTVSNSIGNAKLTYPVALITTDEEMYAGGVGADPVTMTYITNEDFYLRVGYYYWPMTPFAFTNGGAFVARVGSHGLLDYNVVYYSNAVRPVVSLKSYAISGGSGTMTNPFLVG